MCIGISLKKLDLKGRQADKEGRINLWWTNQTLNRYIKGAQCFIEQYGNYTFPEFTGTEAFHVNQRINRLYRKDFLYISIYS